MFSAKLFELLLRSQPLTLLIRAASDSFGLKETQLFVLLRASKEKAAIVKISEFSLSTSILRK